jgi:hypothetical protein
MVHSSVVRCSIGRASSAPRRFASSGTSERPAGPPAAAAGGRCGGAGVRAWRLEQAAEGARRPAAAPRPRSIPRRPAPGPRLSFALFGERSRRRFHLCWRIAIALKTGHVLDRILHA